MHSNTSGPSRAGGVGTTLSLILLATLLAAAAALFCFQQLQPDIKRDLTARVSTALQGTGATEFMVDGQAIVLAGMIGSEAESKKAQEAAQSVYGVSNVINKMTIDSSASAEKTAEADAPETEETPLVLNNTNANSDTGTAPPTLTIAGNNGKISTQGIVPDADTIAQINTALAGKFGRNNIKDELSSFDGSASPEWLGGMLSMIDQLDGIENPVVKVTGTDLVISGAVNAENIRRAKVAAAERLLGSDLNVVDNLTVKADTGDADDTNNADAEQTAESAPTPAAAPTPVVADKRPASIEIRSSNNQISLSGFVADEDDATAIRTGLDNLFGANGYTDELTLSDTVAPATWIDDALSVTSEVRDVTDFSVNIRADQMRLSGSVEDRETGRDLAISATEIAGDELGVLNNFSVNNVTITDTNEELLAQSLLQELEALPTSTIVFNKNSTTLTDPAKEVLEDVAAAILGYSDLVVEIAGHTDTTGDAVRNLRLSQQRAAAVRDYLVENKVPASRLSPIGYGETAPIRDNETDAGRAANRRIEFNL